MNDLKNLEEVLELLKAQEEMQDILEKQQDEIEEIMAENWSRQEQLDESMSLNNMLKRQNQTLQGQNEALQTQISELLS